MNFDYLKPMTESFIEKHKDKVNWYCISRFQKLSESFIEKYEDKVNWFHISRTQKLSESFIEKYQDKVNWDCISQFQKLSESFIEKYQDQVNWYNISISQKLSESFIEKHKDKVDWINISKYQKLLESFIEKYKNKVIWYYISIYQKLSIEFRKKYKIQIKPNNWLYKPVNFKLKKLRECGLYEIIDNKYIIAYKGIRSDNYSKYNFQYLYEIGKEYESNCDCNVNDDFSFGLSAWTLENAKKYCDEKIIKVQIAIKDLGAIVHDGNKLRCFKFKVLEEVL